MCWCEVAESVNAGKGSESGLPVSGGDDVIRCACAVVSAEVAEVGYGEQDQPVSPVFRGHVAGHGVTRF